MAHSVFAKLQRFMKLTIYNKLLLCCCCYYYYYYYYYYYTRFMALCLELPG